MPCLDRAVVNDELVFSLIGFSSYFYGASNVRERQINLLKVIIALQLHLLNLPLLNGGFSEESSAVELVLLVNTLEEDVRDAASTIVTCHGEQGHLDVHDDDLG